MRSVEEKYIKIFSGSVLNVCEFYYIIWSGIGWDLIRVFIKNLKNTGFKICWEKVKLVF